MDTVHDLINPRRDVVYTQSDQYTSGTLTKVNGTVSLYTCTGNQLQQHLEGNIKACSNYVVRIKRSAYFQHVML